VSARSKARKQALDILYESDIRSADPLALLVSRQNLAATDDVPQVREYTQLLIEEISNHRRKIDELIVTYAKGWDMDRLAAVDRNILRLGIYEILWSSDVDDSVAISEALLLARELSGDDSAAFIHGLLSTIIDIQDSISL
jgi:N utilization substance protein B